MLEGIDADLNHPDSQGLTPKILFFFCSTENLTNIGQHCRGGSALPNVRMEGERGLGKSFGDNFRCLPVQ